MIYVRSTRKRLKSTYIYMFRPILFFALDHVHYARWIPVHLCDMVSLKDSEPDVYAEFLKSKFVVHQSRLAFSPIAVDQAHKQTSAL